ncbi:MAG: HAMP domain-containing histidine kinase [Betaproteobacteria bacterium]|jgi:two-component system sensor histidine kinase RegB|nr:HAMP domain-containing histidine kinase [Betaproteobacteria bacterium]
MDFQTAATPPILDLPVADRLRQILRLRTVANVAQLAAIGVAHAAGVALPLGPMVAVIAVLIAVSVWTWRRLAVGAPFRAAEVPAQILLDLFAFSLLLGASGGAGNPFVLFFLLHVVVAALLLPSRLAAGCAALVVLTAAATAAVAPPLRLVDGGPPPADLIAVGYGLSFTLTTAVLTWVIVGAVAAFRVQQQLLESAAQKSVNDAALLHMGTLAAGAAHEMGTPLATMAVIVGELRREPPTPAVAQDAEILAAQIRACRDALAQFASAAGYLRAEGGGRQRVDAFLAATADGFAAARRDVVLERQWEGQRPAPEIFTDQMLKQAILILLNNAGDVSPHHVGFGARWDASTLWVSISDRGPGFTETQLQKLGRVFFTTKAPGKGTGLGLVLATSAVSRLGGTIRWTNRTDGGALAEMQVPLEQLIISTS